MKSSRYSGGKESARKQLHIGRLVARVASILIGAMIMSAILPFFSAGKAVDIVLQIPAGQEPFATDYLSIDSEDYQGARYFEPEVVPEDVIAELENQPEDANEFDGVDVLLQKNTFEITEQFDEQGIPEELLALSEFQLDNTMVYICVSEANVRMAPSGSAEIIGNVKYSNRVQRVGIGSAWTRIQFDDVSEGYILSTSVTTSFIATPTPTPTPTPSPTPKPKITERAASGTYYAKGDLNVRSGPGTSYSLVKSLSAGEPVEVVAKTSNGWYKTIKGTYVLASLVTSTKPGSGSTTPGTTPVVNPVDPSTTDLATYAKSLIGVPYVYTGMSTSGFDCSGYVSYVYANYYNFYLPHQSAQISARGTAVAEADIKVGDVVCYDYSGNGVVDHVSLYIGGGMIVHASSRLGKVVLAYFSMNSVTTIRRFI